MEFKSVTERSIAAIKLVFQGHSYQEIGEKFGVTKVTVGQGVRQLVDTLKEYTDLDIISSSDYAYIQQNKEAILQALNMPFPKRSIYPEARAMLKKHYGNDFAAKAHEIAKNWDQVKSYFNVWRHSRDILSIQSWLASEGFLVGDYISEDMLKFCFKTLQEQLPNVESTADGFYFKIDAVEKGYSDRQLGVNFTLQQGDHKVSRRFRIEMIGLV